MTAAEIIEVLSLHPDYEVMIRSRVEGERVISDELTINHAQMQITIWG